MASLPSRHPNLIIHLADRSLTPILSSSSVRPSNASGPDKRSSQGALAYLSSTLITTHDLAAHLGHGRPKRIMIETGEACSFSQPKSRHDGHGRSKHASTGPVILGTFLDPPAKAEERTLSQTQLSASDHSSMDPARLHVMNAEGEGLVSFPEPSQGSITGREASSLGKRPSTEAEVEGMTSGPPALIGLVLTHDNTDADEARWAAAQLEEVGHAVQAEWAKEVWPGAAAGNGRAC
jgi:hypothetical protein